MEISKESAVSSQYSAEIELLYKKSLADLKIMAKELGVPTSSKLRKKADWVEAIYHYCSKSGTAIAEEETADDVSSTDAAAESMRESTPNNRRIAQRPQPRKTTQHNQPNSYSQKKQYQNNTQNGYNRQQNYQNDYSRQNGYTNYAQQPAYQQNYIQQNGYTGNRPQNDRTPYSQQHGYVQDYQRKKTYPQQNDTYRQPMQNYGSVPQYQPINEQQFYQYPLNSQYKQQDYSQLPEELPQRQPSMNDYTPCIMNQQQPISAPMDESDATVDCEAVLEVMQDGYGFLRSNNYLPGPGDVYVSNQQVRRFKLRTGDLVSGKTRQAQSCEKYPPLLYINSINGESPETSLRRKNFDELIPIYPNKRLTLEHEGDKNLAIRLIDLFAPIGKGQRGLIVSQPKAGKTTLLKEIANGIVENHPDVHLIVLLIDERPEEVTDIKRSIRSKDEERCEVVYSTFDELPDHHTRVAEMVMERSMRLVEQNKDVVVLMDSITRLARAYNITMPSTGKTLSGGMDPSALFKPKRFFGAARNIENGGSLTIIATALVETGSRMDDMVYEEFKGTGNMEIHLDRKLSEKRIFPAVDIYKSGTRHDDLLLSEDEFDCIQSLRRIFSVSNTADVTEQVIGMMAKSANNTQFIELLKAWFAKQEKDGYIK